MPDHCTALRQLIEKQLHRRGLPGAVCRVFPPTTANRLYSIVLEERAARVQFYLQSGFVEQFAISGNEQGLMNDIRSGTRALERLLAKKRTRDQR